MKRVTEWLGLLLVMFPLSVFAIGPRNVTSSGLPVRWGSMPVTVNPESDLNVRGHDVGPLVSDALNTWANLSESDVTFNEVSLGSAIDNTNLCDFFFHVSRCPSGPQNDGNNPLIIDEDGAIVAS